MTNEEKKELLIALCDYHPYGVIVEVEGYDISKLKGIDNGTVSTERGINYPLRLVKPFLRPMESMTEEEKYIWHSKMKYAGYFINYKYYDTVASFDYLNSIHVDYRGLIPKGLAIEAKEGMYNLKKS